MQKLEKVKSPKDVAAKFIESESGASSVWKKNEKKNYDTLKNLSPSRQRVNFDIFEKINQSLLKWVTLMHGNNIPTLRSLRNYWLI